MSQQWPSPLLAQIGSSYALRHIRVYTEPDWLGVETNDGSAVEDPIPHQLAEVGLGKAAQRVGEGKTWGEWGLRAGSVEASSAVSKPQFKAWMA